MPRGSSSASVRTALARFARESGAGSRYLPHTVEYNTPPGQYIFGYVIVCPIRTSLAHAATYVAKHTNAKISFRDSIALQESYQDGFVWAQKQEPDLIFIETATPSWEARF